MAVSTICSGVWCSPVYTTSIPASRRARATTLAPRSWPSRPGLATTTLIRSSLTPSSLGVRGHRGTAPHPPGEYREGRVADPRDEQPGPRHGPPEVGGRDGVTESA